MLCLHHHLLFLFFLLRILSFGNLVKKRQPSRRSFGRRLLMTAANSPVYPLIVIVVAVIIMWRPASAYALILRMHVKHGHLSPRSSIRLWSAAIASCCKPKNGPNDGNGELIKSPSTDREPNPTKHRPLTISSSSSSSHSHPYIVFFFSLSRLATVATFHLFNRLSFLAVTRRQVPC